MLCGAGGNAERSAAGRKTVVSDCRVVADSWGGSAARGAGEKTSALKVAPLDEIAVAASGGTSSAESLKGKPSFPIAAPSPTLWAEERRKTTKARKRRI